MFNTSSAAPREEWLVSLLRFVFRLLLGRRLPVTSGSLCAPGIHGGLRIHRDRWGIPLLEADDPRDGPFAVGFCQGQDRTFQLELLLRVGRGTLAELIGPAGLPVDRLSRRIGFHRAAGEQLTQLAPDVRATVESYARGVVAGGTRGRSSPPHEFALLGLRQPTPWTAQDTLAVTKMLSFTLAANWDAELARLEVLDTDGPEALAALDGPYPGHQPSISPVGKPAGAVEWLARDLRAFLAWAPPGGGSNNWVVASSRTTTGRPLLANDPHLDAKLPTHWYLFGLRTPAGAVAGASFVGGPSVVIGHNGVGAWGITAGLVDNTDLFLEEIGPDGSSVRQGSEWLPCRLAEEVIPVKGAEPVCERVLLTPRGPIISPSLGGPARALSLRATWLDPLPVTGIFRVHQARSFAEFREAFRDWPLASLNMVYADTSGTIGWQLIGRVPVRKQGHGLFPLEGKNPEVGWHEEPLPFEQVPHLSDPECGFLATANNRHLPDGEGPFLGADFTDGYRVEAIQSALAARSDWDVPRTMTLQMDQHARAWQEMREVVLAAPGPASLMAMLRDWDGNVGIDSPAAAVYELLVAEMVQRVARAKAPRSWRWLLGEPFSALTPHNFGCFRRTAHLVRLLREQPHGWFARAWPAELADALASVEKLLTTRFGAEPAGWAWGRIRPLVMHHPLSRKPGLLGQALGRIFNLGPVPCGGDCDVINQAAALPLDPLAPTDNIPSMRAVIDVGAWHNSRFVLPGGQSGNPLSPHYGDLLVLWQRGEGVPIAFTPEEVKAAAVETLTLQPEK